jgi:hypothetical protein
MILTIVGSLLPLLVFIIIYAWPKESDKPASAEEEKDSYRVLRIFFLVLILLGFCGALVLGFKLEVEFEHRAQVSDVGFTTIENIFRRNKKKKSVKRKSKFTQPQHQDLARPKVEERSYKKVFSQMMFDKERQMQDDLHSQVPKNLFADFDIDERASRMKSDINYRRTMDVGGLSKAPFGQPNQPQRVLDSVGDAMYHGPPLEDASHGRDDVLREYNANRNLASTIKSSSKKVSPYDSKPPQPKRTIDRNLEIGIGDRRKINLGHAGEEYLSGMGNGTGMDWYDAHSQNSADQSMVDNLYYGQPPTTLHDINKMDWDSREIRPAYGVGPEPRRDNYFP